MRLVPSRYKPGATGNQVADAVGAGLRVWLTKTIEEPLPERMIAMVLKLEESSSSDQADQGSSEE
jgi:hypothetical protein